MPADCAQLPTGEELQVTLHDRSALRVHSARIEGDSLIGYGDAVTPDGARFPLRRVAVALSEVATIEQRHVGMAQTSAVAVTSATFAAVATFVLIALGYGFWI